MGSGNNKLNQPLLLDICNDICSHLVVQNRRDTFAQFLHRSGLHTHPVNKNVAIKYAFEPIIWYNKNTIHVLHVHISCNKIPKFGEVLI